MKPLLRALTPFYLTGIALATTAEASAQGEPAPADREQRDMELLAQSVAPRAVVWLRAGSERVLALFEPDRSGAPRGAVLLLHDAGQHPAWPEILENIRSTLPGHGWATLAISLPPPARVPVPPRPVKTAPGEVAGDNMAGEENIAGETDPRENDESPQSGDEQAETGADADPPGDPDPPAGEEEKGEDSGSVTSGEPAAAEPLPDTAEKTKIPVEQRAALRLSAALEYLRQRNIYNIVLLGEGAGATRIGAFLQSQSDNTSDAVRAAVIINARNNLPMADIDLPRCFRNPQLPVLDIFFGTSPRQRRDAEQRLIHARRNRFSAYRQIRLPETVDTPVYTVDIGAENRVTRHIRGFLQKHAAGGEKDLTTGLAQ